MKPIQKRLLKTALYTSPVIALIAVAPIYVVMHFHNLPSHALSYPAYLVTGVVLVTIRTLFVWGINILLFTGISERVSGRATIHPGLIMISYVVVLTFIAAYQYVFDPVGTGGYDPTEHLLDSPTGYVFWLVIGFAINTVVLVIQSLTLMSERKAEIELENARLRLSRSEAVNEQLKQQMQPHFVFNSLNILKTLIKKDAVKAEAYLMRLSAFLRRTLTSFGTDAVSLEEELQLATDYLEMQKVRFGESLASEIDVPDEVRKDGLVPVLSIQPLIENAVKHNFMSKASPLRISVRSREGWIDVENNLQLRTNGQSSTERGLANLAERYRMLSGDDVVVERSATSFTVSIRILDRSRIRKKHSNVAT